MFHPEGWGWDIPRDNDTLQSRAIKRLLAPDSCSEILRVQGSKVTVEFSHTDMGPGVQQKRLWIQSASRNKTSGDSQFTEDKEVFTRNYLTPQP